jgi:hypothetical protein
LEGVIFWERAEELVLSTVMSQCSFVFGEVSAGLRYDIFLLVRWDREKVLVARGQKMGAK